MSPISLHPRAGFIKKNRTKTLLASACLLLAADVSAMSQPPSVLTTELVFTNSTDQTLTVSLAGDGELLSADIPPLATRTLTRLERSAAAEQTVQLHLQGAADGLTLEQTLDGLSLSFSAHGTGWTLPSFSDGNLHQQTVNFGAAPARVAVKGEDTDAGGRLTYVLQPLRAQPRQQDAGEFALLGYNIWATTIYGSQKVDTRLAEMPAVMAGYDALVLTEVFDALPSNELLDALRAEYPYQTGDIFKAGKLMPSGTRILSRWPIEREDSYAYDACDGIQCAATRGVIYARINKLGKAYNLFATHTQSSDDDVNRQARLAQLAEMGQFIQRLNLPASEPVLMAGDYNINKIGLPGDRDRMETLLNATEPQNLGHALSFDSDTNHWAEKPYLEYLDYTLFSRVNQAPLAASQRIFAPRVITDSLWGEWDLSDHYAAEGLFRFDASQTVRNEFPFAGDVVHLQTSNGHFLRAMSGGGSFISAGSSQVGTWESFIPQVRGDGRIALKARDGSYVGLDSYLVGTLTTGHDLNSAAAAFTLVDLGNNRVALLADNGRYVRADFGGGAGVSAASSAVGDNQTFRLIRP
ncbi:endonuclease/exonuclease/phosphatase family protein [Thalassolituus sp. LLYu03]|uniref:endonuclease/exonuclease/phosphatase family protein n=1 Tax=Thalassolituus sp. LLYu03 TaxID=3421656 RepID=UPI003D2CB587